MNAEGLWIYLGLTSNLFEGFELCQMIWIGLIFGVVEFWVHDWIPPMGYWVSVNISKYVRILGFRNAGISLNWRLEGLLVI